MITKTWLPLFNGFYGTIFEPDEEMELCSIEQKRAENGLPALEDLFELCEFDYDGYQKGIAKSCVNYVFGLLETLGVVFSIEFEDISSPKEYNFANDSINVVVGMSGKNVDNMVEYIHKYPDEWKQYLKDKYTSRDGFSSFYSNDPLDWNIRECLEDDHKCGSILEFMVFCYANEKEEEYDRLYESMHEIATSNNSLQAENFIELTENYKCNCCDSFIHNEQYARSLKHRLNMKYIQLDQIMCSDCALKYDNTAVLN